MTLLVGFIPQAIDSEGRSVPDALLYSYEAGTYTPKPTYSNPALSLQNANPLEADGAGRFFDVYLGAGGYRLEVRNSAGTVLWEQDDYYAGLDGSDLINIDADIAETQQMISQTIYVGVDGGVADAYTLTAAGIQVEPDAYGDGMIIYFVPANTNTGASTVNIAGLGIKNLVLPGGGALPAGFLIPQTIYGFTYYAGSFIYFFRSGYVVTDMIEDLAVTTAKIANLAITTGKIADEAVTYDKMADGTAYELLGYASDGEATSYKNPLRLLSSGSLTATGSLQFVLSTLDTAQSESNHYMLRLIGFQPSSDDVNLYATLSSDAGSTYANTGYAWVCNGRICIGGVTQRVYGDDSDSEIEISGATGATDAMSNAAGETSDMVIWISGMNTGASVRPSIKYKLSMYEANGNIVFADGGGTNTTAADYDAIKFTWEGAGNFAAVGSYLLYKITESLQ